MVAMVVQPYALDALIPALYLGYGSAIVLRSLKGADALGQVRFESGEASGRILRWIGIALICSALVDLALQQGENITEAMLGSGFNTKSNFNREFLRITGKTPREYRG